MRPAPRSRWVWVTVIVVVGVGWTTAVLWQRQTARDLRAELARLREEPLDWKGLEAENRRLSTLRPAPADLARLRADHEALPRLRDEIEALKQQVAARGQ